MRTRSIQEIEAHSATLQRNLEMVRRRGNAYQEIDRAGYLLLRTVDSIGPADISSLSEVLGVDPSTLGRQVAVAEARGLLTRTPATQDRRQRIVGVTPTGRTAMNAVCERRKAAATEMLMEWSDQDLDTLAQMFARYNDAVAARYRISAYTGIIP